MNDNAGDDGGDDGDGEKMRIDTYPLSALERKIFYSSPCKISRAV